MATRGLLRALAGQYAHDTGIAVRAEADGGVRVAARIRAGEAIDVVVLADSSIEELSGEGTVIPGTRTELVRSGIAVAVRAGARRPEIATADNLRQAVLAAGSLGYSTGPSGRYLEQLFGRFGILESIRGRITVAPAGTPVASLIASGAVELGFQQLSEMLEVPGIDILGPLPAAIQSFTVFSGAIAACCHDRAAAGALLDYLASPAHAEILHRFGMQRP